MRRITNHEKTLFTTRKTQTTDCLSTSYPTEVTDLQRIITGFLPNITSGDRETMLLTVQTIFFCISRLSKYRQHFLSTD